MPFKAMLTALVREVPGATGAILADWEGEAVEQYSLLDPYEMKVIAAHWEIILTQLRQLRRNHPLGGLQEGIITSTDQHVLVAPVGDEYTLVMTLSRNALPRRALRNFKATIDLLKKEIY